MSPKDELRELVGRLREYAQWLQRGGVRLVPHAVIEARLGTTQLPGIPSMEPNGGPGFGCAETLAEIRAALGDCQRCKLCRQRTNIVFGAGNPKARLVFVGEGPGQEEDRQGEPFVGAAGQLLTKMIGAMGLGRQDVYICNVIKCRPPGNRNPEPDEIEACEPFLKRQLGAIQPEVIVCLGKFAAQCLLRSEAPISKLRGRFHQYQGIALMPTYHPAYLLRNPDAKREVWSDLQNVMAKLSLPVKSL